MEQADSQYGLHVEYIAEPDFKKGLVNYLEQTRVRAIVLGTRRGDPNAGGQDTFCPSSEGWPAFMRVNPILDWTYGDVWAFLRATYVGIHAVVCVEPTGACTVGEIRVCVYCGLMFGSSKEGYQ